MKHAEKEKQELSDSTDMSWNPENSSSIFVPWRLIWTQRKSIPLSLIAHANHQVLKTLFKKKIS